MKKMISLLLATLMCFSLVACGSNEVKFDDTGNDNANVITLTMGNWEDYFEIKDAIYVSPNSGIYPDNTMVLKEGYTIEGIEIEFEYTYTKEYCFVEIDEEEKEVVIGEVDPEKASEEITSSRHCSGLNEDGEVTISLVDSWQTHKYDEDKISMTIMKDIEITSFEGTLTLSK